MSHLFIKEQRACFIDFDFKSILVLELLFIDLFEFCMLLFPILGFMILYPRFCIVELGTTKALATNLAGFILLGFKIVPYLG